MSKVKLLEYKVFALSQFPLAVSEPAKFEKVASQKTGLGVSMVQTSRGRAQSTPWGISMNSTEIVPEMSA